MNNAETVFLVRLSHEWFLPILLTTATASMGYFLCARSRNRLRAAHSQKYAIAQTASYFTGVLSAISFCALFASCLHIGCAAMLAREHICSSNLRELSMGALLYLQDYDETFPPREHWAELCAPPVNKAAGPEQRTPRADVFRCPCADGSRLSYAFNGQLGSTALADLAAPRYTVMIFDAEQPPGTRVSGRSLYGGKELLTNARHEGAFAVYVDGHGPSMPGHIGTSDSSWNPKVPAEPGR